MDINYLIDKEKQRQNQTIPLIASENFISEDVAKAIGSVFTNKYAEGYPLKRYYGGNLVVDELETYVQNLAKKLFSTDYHVNVQAYSGSVANLAIYSAFLNPGDKFLGLELSHGGHLSHGHEATFTGKIYQRIPYFINPTTFSIDYRELEKIAQTTRPKLIVSGASAYAKKIDFVEIDRIARQVGAIHLADISHISGLVATGLHPTPFPNADIVMTTTHKILRGPKGAIIFSKQDYKNKLDRAIFPGLQGGPHMSNIAGIGVALEEALLPSYKEYCQEVIDNADTLACELKKLGFTIVGDTTENHLFLIDLRPQKITGQEAQDRLENRGIIVNKNMIPFDDASAHNPSGIRIGTPAITTLKATKKDMIELAKKIKDCLD